MSLDSAGMSIATNGLSRPDGRRARDFVTSHTECFPLSDLLFIGKLSIERRLIGDDGKHRGDYTEKIRYTLKLATFVS